MNFYTLPQALYPLTEIKEILTFEENAILYKELEKDLIDNEKLITSHSIVYVVNGEVSVTTYDGDEVKIGSGEMLFMPRDSYLISDFICHGKTMQSFLLFFDHHIAIKFLDGFRSDSEHKNSVCKLDVTKNIQYYLENIRQMSFESSHNQALLELKLLEFLHLVPNNQKFMETLEASERGKQKRDIELLMLEHYDKNLTISDFASLSGRSLSTFNREFKQKHNTTPKQWLIEKKMNRAFQLLQEGQTVTQSAFDVGYLNVSNFIKAYKSIYGETPKVMQKAKL